MSFLLVIYVYRVEWGTFSIYCWKTGKTAETVVKGCQWIDSSTSVWRSFIESAPVLEWEREGNVVNRASKYCLKSESWDIDGWMRRTLKRAWWGRKYKRLLWFRKKPSVGEGLGALNSWVMENKILDTLLCNFSYFFISVEPYLSDDT